MWTVVTHATGEPFTLGGRLVVHDNRAELEWLIPTHPTRKLPGRTPEEVSARLGIPVMRLRDHPDLAGIQWPLRREDFVR